MIILILDDLDYFGNIEDIKDFAVTGDAYISIEGSKGADCFFMIITPKHLNKWLKEVKVISPKAMFIVNEDSMAENMQLIEEQIKHYLKDCMRET